MTNKIIFLMDLPSPIHGMSNVNLAVKNKAVQDGLKPFVINSVPSYAVKFIGTKLWGILKILHSLYCILTLLFVSFFNFKGVLYRPINGGNGQLYDLLYLAIARLFQYKIYIHHHSFSYLNNRSRLFALVKTIAGNNATHIVLGNKMKTVLSALYNINKDNIFVISNLAYFNALNAKIVAPKDAFKIGHLSNLCTEKGVDIFIDVCRSLHEKHINYKAKIAGPFSDVATKKLVLKAVKDLPKLHYVGPLYKQEKLDYYQQLDCFIFPSKYSNEAEPLVLFEAANDGALLIGTQRGCMKDVIHSLAGESFEEDEHLVANIVASITKAIEAQSLNSTNKQQRSDIFRREQGKATIAFGKFLEEMGSYGTSRS